MSNIEDPVVLLERNLYGHPLAGLLWERQFEECTHRECKPNETNFEEDRKMFESIFFCWSNSKKNARVGDTSREKLSHRHYDMERHAKKCAELILTSERRKTFQKLYNGLYS